MLASLACCWWIDGATAGGEEAESEVYRRCDGLMEAGGDGGRRQGGVGSIMSGSRFGIE